ncbi:putative diguanylate cyclase YdaM [Marinomonas aquimarina]|uniref:diguanylate cyclase n=1 Tax=Marinomonas aquimarina TaxID=295068 RepID=A0A1A8TRW5_9GAMM|nr:diguanylate cyclase [Marinomonas aquimarina]SBS35699.1 putative diguanylate cyclase YdaM [Marinomonas aquimarina]
MKPDIKALEQKVIDVLANEAYQGHPLHDVLNELWDYNQSQWARMEHMIRLSDSYQDMIIQREKTLGERFDKHLRQLEKITRISDRYQTALREANLELEQASYADALTGLPNRRKMLRRLKSEFEMCRQGICLAMIDIDHFKTINDAYGHLVGDDVLVSVGNLIERTVGELGHISRWGGEEFLVIFSQVEQAQVEQCLRHLTKVIREAHFDNGEAYDIRTTISIGMSHYQADDSIDSLITRADNALYKAKNSGRDRFVIG